MTSKKILRNFGVYYRKVFDVKIAMSSSRRALGCFVFLLASSFFTTGFKSPYTANFVRQNVLNSESSSVDEIPNEIIEAEARSASGRGPRLAIAGLAATAAVGMGVTQAFAIKGAVDPGIVPSFLDNPPLSLVISFGIAGGAGALIKSELATKAANQRRIWEAVKEKQKQKIEEPKKGPSRAERRRKGGGKIQSLESFDIASVPTTRPKSERDTGDNKDGGLLENFVGSVATAFPEANAIAANSAMQLNTALEEKGILEPITSASTKQDEASVIEEENMSKTQRKKLEQAKNNKKKKKSKNKR